MKTFTVTIAGTERFDGEAPYTWVVEASDVTSAMNKALAYHALSQEQRLCDLEIIPLHTFEGLPPENCGYYWNDLRLAALEADGESECMIRALRSGPLSTTAEKIWDQAHFS